jgi:hypothetical protein
MATTETMHHSTPNGGVRSVAYYRDSAGNPVEKEVATHVEIVEFGSTGEAIHRTYANLEVQPNSGDPDTAPAG